MSRPNPGMKRLKSSLQSFANEIPGFGNKETLVHILNHLLEARHGDGEGQPAGRDAGAGGDVKHAEDASRIFQPRLLQRIIDDGSTAGTHGSDHAMRIGAVVIRQGEQTGEDIRCGKEYDREGIFTRNQLVQAFENEVFAGSGEGGMDLQVFFDKIWRLLIALAIKLTGDAAGKKIFEIGTQFGGKTTVAFATGATGGMSIIDVGMPFLDLGEVADQAAVTVDRVFLVLFKRGIGVVIADGQVGAGEVLVPAREEGRDEGRVHGKYLCVDWGLLVLDRL
jgi:hypothetical protein